MTRARATIHQQLVQARDRLARLTRPNQSVLIRAEVVTGARNLVAELERELAQIDDRTEETSEAAAAALAAERERNLSEEASFWFRRFFLTLGFGNTAAFAAVAGGFLQADERASIATPVASALTNFSIGMVAAGLLPLLLWLQIETRQLMKMPWFSALARDVVRWLVKCTFLSVAGGAALVSALCLFQGFGFAIGGIRGLVPH